MGRHLVDDVEWVEEPSYFFRLSEWQEPLIKFYRDNPDFISPKSRYNEVLKFVESGLRDLSVSRTSFTWGIKVPGNESHVMYVWLDALVNYLSAIGYPDVSSESFKKFWPADFHIVGKDILRFHGVYWPAFLMAADLPLPKRLVAHGWWTVEKEKMSKSLGNVVDPNEVVSEFGLDQFRYFLLREVPFGNDGDFSRESLIARINADLANNLGNLINRVFAMTAKNFDGKIPGYSDILESEHALQNKIIDLVELFKKHFSATEFSKALSVVIEIVSLINKYIDTQKPWSLAKNENTSRLSTVLRTSLESIRVVSFLIYPVMPKSSLKILESLGFQEESLSFSPEKINNFNFLSEDWVVKSLDLILIEFPLDKLTYIFFQPFSNRIIIFDTTLRDGEQSPGASMTVKDIVEDCKNLEKLGVDIIEAGFPIASEGDFNSVKLIAKNIKDCEVAGLSRANLKDIDRAWEAIKDAANPRIHTFIATSNIHLKYKLKKTKEEVLSIIKTWEC